MPTAKPGYSLRLWLSFEDLEKLKKAAAVTGLQQSEIMSQLMHAALICIEGDGYRLHFPLKFGLIDGIPIEKKGAPLIVKPSRQGHHARA
jgi:hypothetical protein